MKFERASLLLDVEVFSSNYKLSSKIYNVHDKFY